MGQELGLMHAVKLPKKAPPPPGGRRNYPLDPDTPPQEKLWIHTYTCMHIKMKCIFYILWKIWRQEQEHISTHQKQIHMDSYFSALKQ